MARNLDAATTYVAARCASLSYPALSAPEIQDILADNLNYTSIWTPSTFFAYGTFIVPTVRNGHHYKCRVAGVSGTVEPTWLSFLDFVSVSASGYAYTTDYAAIKNVGIILVDGTATWQENGSDWDEQYNLRNAIYDAWMLKAAKTAADHQFAGDLQVFHRQQVYEHCNTEAAKWAPQRIT